MLLVPFSAFCQKNARKEDPRPKATRQDSLYICILKTGSNEHVQNSRAHLDLECEKLGKCRGELRKVPFFVARNKYKTRTCELCCKQSSF